MEQTENAQAMVDMGKWIGRRQAFRLVTNKCSAAEAECLKNIREAGAYREMDLTWDQFCPQELGISRSYADRLIQQFEEFGEAYFKLAEVMRITADSFRQIADAVKDQCVVFKDEEIFICRENAGKIIRAVHALQKEAKDAAIEVVHARCAAMVSPFDSRRIELAIASSVADFEVWMAHLRTLTLYTLRTDHCYKVVDLINNTFVPDINKLLKTFEDGSKGPGIPVCPPLKPVSQPSETPPPQNGGRKKMPPECQTSSSTQRRRNR